MSGLAAAPLGGENAGVLIAGSGRVGATVASIVADGTGKSDVWTFMANAYFDFNSKGKVNP
jgi:hypothetical protein